MKTNGELNSLFAAFIFARDNYINAVEANIREYGKEISVLDNGENIVLDAIDGENSTYTEINAVRWNKKEGYVECHIVYLNERDCDIWANVESLGNERIYFYCSIDFDF